MDNAVVYCATSNHYPYIPTCVKSLRENGYDGTVICYVEDDDISFDGVVCKNYKKEYNYLAENGPNYKSVFSYMSLVRLAFARLLPNFDKVLYLDTDTVVCGDISPLWDIDMTDYYIAGASEDLSYVPQVPIGKYINAGVMLMNLDKIRKDGIDWKWLWEINGFKHNFPDHDVINIYCLDHIYYLDKNYNEFCRTQISQDPKIVHYAGEKNWWLPSNPRSKYWNTYTSKSF